MDVIAEIDADTKLADLIAHVERGETVVLKHGARVIATLSPNPDDIEARRERAQGAAERILERANESTLGGFDWKALRDEGRKW